MSEKAITDELYGRAIEIIMSAEKYSVSLLQRKLGLGYTDASNLLDYIACKHIAEIKRLREALDEAVKLIEYWHNIGARDLPKTLLDKAWKIYYEKSPEMELIREARKD